MPRARAHHRCFPHCRRRYRYRGLSARISRQRPCNKQCVKRRRRDAYLFCNERAMPGLLPVLSVARMRSASPLCGCNKSVVEALRRSARAQRGSPSSVASVASPPPSTSTGACVSLSTSSKPLPRRIADGRSRFPTTTAWIPRAPHVHAQRRYRQAGRRTTVAPTQRAAAVSKLV